MANINVKKVTNKIDLVIDSESTTSSKVTVNIYAYGGYSFTGNVITVTFKNPDKPFQAAEKHSITPNKDNIVATGAFSWFYDNVNIEITGDNIVKEDSSHISLTLGNLVNNVPNTTLQQFDTGYQFQEDGKTFEKFKIVLTADSNYVFVADSVKNDLGAKFTISDDLKTAYQFLNNNISNLNVGWTFTGQTVYKADETKIVNDIAKTTESHTIDGTNVNVTITGKSPTGLKRYVNAKVSYTNVDGETVTNELSSIDNLTLNVSLSDVKVGTTVNITGAFRFVCLVDNNLTGCNVTGIKDYYIENETVNVVATANNNTSFDKNNVPVAEWETLYHGTESFNFTVSEDGKTATLILSLGDSSEKVSESTITLNGGTIPDKVVTGYGSINVYCVNDDILDEFSKVRFVKTVSDNDYSLYDLGNYINRLQKVFVPVSDVTDTSLKLANFDTGITVNSVNNPIINIDFGKCNIPSINSDNVDFQSNVQIFVPFVGFITLDNDILGKSIDLSYKIDLVQGYASYTICCDEVVINNGVTKCYSDVLYKTSDKETFEPIGGDNFLNTVLMGLNPYVTVKYFVSKTESLNDLSNRDILSQFSGFSKFKNVSLIDFECLTNEKDEIITLLNNGVYL